VLLGFGMRGNLVDKQGFPLNDVDKILSVREARNKVARMSLHTAHASFLE
jgi:hypothetical protein